MSREFLNEMLTTASVSGNEAEIQGKIKKYMESAVDSFMEDEMGNVISVMNADSDKKVLLSAHIDEIGLRVTYIRDDGMLKVGKIGGIYTESYLGQKVRVLSKNGVIYGSVAINHDLCKKNPLGPENLTVDIGAESREDAEKYVSVGDDVIFDTEYRDLLNDKISARALDDKIGAYVILEAFKRAKERGCKAGVYAATTVGEETSKDGAYWVSSRVEPTESIVVDVTYTCDYDGFAPDHYGEVKLGCGPALCNNPMLHRGMNGILTEIAKEKNMPYQMEVTCGNTCTDADRIHFFGKGVPVVLVQVPMRYMHSPAEVVSMKDVENCIELIAEYLVRL